MTMFDFLRPESTPYCMRLKSGNGLETLAGMNELGERRILYSATWKTKSVASGLRFFRASFRTPKNETSAFYYAPPRIEPDLFVLETSTSESGLYTPALVLPISAWQECMGEMKEKITTLFCRCRLWKSTLIIKKELSFESNPGETSL